jgi:hypothetical protein
MPVRLTFAVVARARGLESTLPGAVRSRSPLAPAPRSARRPAALPPPAPARRLSLRRTMAASTAAPLIPLYPHIEAFASGMLRVSALHEMYVASSPPPPSSAAAGARRGMQLT